MLLLFSLSPVLHFLPELNKTLDCSLQTLPSVEGTSSVVRNSVGLKNVYHLMFLSVTFTLSSPVVLASGPGTPDSIEGVSQHLSPESSRKAYCRTWDQPSQSASFTHMPQSPNVFNEHMTNNTMSPGTAAAQSLKSPASIRSRSVSDSSVPRRGNFCCQYTSSVLR